MKSPGISVCTEARGEIGYISNSNVQPKLVRVKASVANIPVATESLQRMTATQGKWDRN